MTFWTILATYGVINAFIYSWFFWDKFNINIIQFASFNDLLPFIIYTMAIPIAILGVVFVLLNCWEFIVAHLFPKVDDYVDEKNLPRYLAGVFQISSMIAFIALLCFVIVSLYPGFNFQAMVIDGFSYTKLMLGAVCYLSAAFLASLDNLLPNIKNFRLVIFALFLSMPIFVYSVADEQADLILKGVNTLIITSKVDCDSKQGEKFRYISTISDKTFALSLKDGSICIFKYSYLRLEAEDKIKLISISSSSPANRA